MGYMKHLDTALMEGAISAAVWASAQPPRNTAEAVIEAAGELGRLDGAGSDHECDLSGEWADRETPAEVLRRAMNAANVTDDEFDFAAETDALDAYEAAWNEAAGASEPDVCVMYCPGCEWDAVCPSNGTHASV